MKVLTVCVRYQPHVQGLTVVGASGTGLAVTLERARIARVLAELNEELSLISGLLAEMEGLKPTESAYTRALASILHDFYSGAEKIFRKIAEDLNGGLPAGEDWHRQLLHAMALTIPELRPAVISVETEAALLEFLRFRHIFRNVYGFALKPEKLAELRGRLPVTHAMFIQELRIFTAWLGNVQRGS